MQAEKKPFNKALSVMNLEETIDEEVAGSTETPVCKKPRCYSKVESSLSLTPPAVVGPQTVSRPTSHVLAIRFSPNISSQMVSTVKVYQAISNTCA